MSDLPAVTVAAAQTHLLHKTKPPGSLGRLEDWCAKLMVVQGTLHPAVSRPRVVLFAADNGLSALSQYPRAVTREMLANVARGGAAINALTRAHAIDLRVADLGVDLPVDARFAEVDHFRLMATGARDPLPSKDAAVDDATAAATEGAMDPTAFSYALGNGRKVLQQAARDGIDVLGIGELGIGNTAVASVLLSAATGADAADVTGKGTGVEGDRYIAKVAGVRAVIEAWRARGVVPPTPTSHPDPLALVEFDWARVLQTVGDLEVAAMAGLIHEAAITPDAHILVVVDGFITQAALLYALLLHPDAAAAIVRHTLIAHASAEKGSAFMLAALQRAAEARGVSSEDAAAWATPVGNWGMRLGEGTGAALVIPMLRSAASIAGMATFAAAGVSTEKTE